MDIHYDKLNWSAFGNELVPESVCSMPCKTKEYCVQKELICCWECRQCRKNEIIVDQERCEQCDLTTWPD